MTWIRLDDDYIHHAKFVALSDRAFRLWHEGMAYCRKALTDGAIPFATLKTFRYAKPGAVKELATSVGQLAPLWESTAQGYQVHDYLDWNAARDEDQSERDAAKLRMRAYRGRERTPSVTPGVTPSVTPDVTPPVPGEGKGLEREEEDLRRAGRLIQRYQELYPVYRNGAKLRIIGNSLDFQEALSLCGTWDDAHLDKLATLVLKTDDEFIAKTDRSFKIFALKASWADDRLKAWEVAHGIAQ